jgi:hypothetical protein
MIGDVVETGRRLEETCGMLAEAGVMGVWGNHDIGLCVEPDEEFAARYGPVAMDYMASLRPRLEIGECHFSHVEPWLNPEIFDEIWYWQGTPQEHGDLDRIFRAVPHRLIFVGHYHQWLHARPDGITPWRGDVPIRLDQGRHFIVVGPLCEGCYATFDTETSELAPFHDALGKTFLDPNDAEA